MTKNDDAIPRKHSYRMKELPPEQRPYEKCCSLGPEALSDVELLSVILRSGMPGRNVSELATELLILLEDHGGLGGLCEISSAELTTCRGIGTIKAAQLRCIGELVRRIAMSQNKPLIQLNSPETIAAYFMEDMCHRDQEVVMAAFFNSKNRLIRTSCLTTGTVNASLITPREVFLEALRYKAVTVVLLHNHPSGDPTPSEEDILLTNMLQDCGFMLSVPLMDHIIIGDHCYVSLMEQGYIQGMRAR